MFSSGTFAVVVIGHLVVLEDHTTYGTLGCAFRTLAFAQCFSLRDCPQQSNV